MMTITTLVGRSLQLEIPFIPSLEATANKWKLLGPALAGPMQRHSSPRLPRWVNASSFKLQRFNRQENF